MRAVFGNTIRQRRGLDRTIETHTVSILYAHFLALLLAVWAYLLTERNSADMKVALDRLYSASA